MALLILYRTCASFNWYKEKEKTTYRQPTRWPVVPPKNMFTNWFIRFPTRPKCIVVTAHHITPLSNHWWRERSFLNSVEDCRRTAQRRSGSSRRMNAGLKKSTESGYTVVACSPWHRNKRPHSLFAKPRAAPTRTLYPCEVSNVYLR